MNLLLRPLAILPTALFLAIPAPGEIVIEQKPAAKAETNKTALPAPVGSASEIARFDTLELLSGDVFRGTFLGYDTRSGLKFQHPAVRNALELNPTRLWRLRLDRPRGSQAAPRQTCSVRFFNGDELIGELLTLDDQQLQLETWYAGTLTIPRKSIQAIAPGVARIAALYEGPTSMEGWTSKGSTGRRIVNGVETSRGPWKYANEAFTSSGAGTIGRDLKLPASVNIEFDMAWRGYLQFIVGFYSDSMEPFNGSGYSLNFNYNSLYLQRTTKSGDSAMLGQSEATQLSQKSRARVSIRVNKEARTIALLLDGNLVKQWTDKDDMDKLGGNLLFMQQGGASVKISKIRVTEWDGKLDAAGGRVSKLKEDLIRLGNNDSMSGAVTAIKDGKLTFKTAFAPLDVPVDRIAEISLLNTNPPVTLTNATDVKLVFADRGAVTVKIERWDDQQVTASSTNLGRVKFTPSAFGSVIFNLDKKKEEPAESEFDGGGSGWGGGMMIID